MTSSLRPGHLLRAAFVLGITSGCGNSLGPTDLVGRYTLARVNEAPPPQVVGATISCDLLLTGGRLELRTSDWSALTLDQRQDCSRVGGPTSVTSLLYLGTFHVTGSTLTFETLRSIDDTLRFAPDCVGWRDAVGERRCARSAGPDRAAVWTPTATLVISRPDSTSRPNKRLKLSGGDRSKGSGVLCP